ncbi:MAG TPA: nuclear transport factor 2 family protein [Kofleriaceae bacterium]
MFDPNDWYAAWNAHDLERVIAHYADDIRFYSPFATALVPGSNGLIRGKAALRSYFTAALAKYPELVFVPLGTYEGAGSTTLHYKSVAGKTAAEMFVLDDHGAVIEVRAHYL